MRAGFAGILLAALLFVAFFPLVTSSTRRWLDPQTASGRPEPRIFRRSTWKNPGLISPSKWYSIIAASPCFCTTEEDAFRSLCYVMRATGFPDGAPTPQPRRLRSGSGLFCKPIVVPRTWASLGSVEKLAP